MPSITYRLSLEESVFGADKKISFQLENRIEDINVKIPAGINSGKKLRLPGKGLSGLNGGPSGDLYLNINVLPHPIYARDGNDLYIEKTIKFTQAASGNYHRCAYIRWLCKETKAQSRHSEQYQDKNEGLWRTGIKRRSKGDQYVKINVEVPKKLSDRQMKLVKQLADDGI